MLALSPHVLHHRAAAICVVGPASQQSCAVPSLASAANDVGVGDAADAVADSACVGATVVDRVVA
eukprot:10267595-Alexandrium_andersonii.AAC.1